MTTMTVPAAVAAWQAGQLSSAVSIVDWAAAVQANLDTLQAIAFAGDLSSIIFLDGSAPTLTITATQLKTDSTALGQISGSYALALTNAATLTATGNIAATGAGIYAAASKILSISNSGTIQNQGTVPDIDVHGTIANGITNLSGGSIISNISDAIAIAPVGSVSFISSAGTIQSSSGTNISNGANTYPAIFVGGTISGGINNLAGGLINGSHSQGINVSSTATVSSISNAGTIQTTGAYSCIVDYGTVTSGIVNSGTITAQNSNSADIWVDQTGHVGPITNSGTLNSLSSASDTASTCKGLNIWGVVNGDITNSGSITATGGNVNAAFGISIRPGGTVAGNIVNSGQISVSGTGSGAVTSTDGKISYTATGSIGIEVVNGASVSGTIVNAAGGTITNTSAGQFGIKIGNTNTEMDIVNAGTISTVSGTAIDRSTAGAASTITNSGTIIGAIKLAPLGDTLTVTGGSINGDILTAAAGQGSVNIAVGAGNIFTAGGKMGDPSGAALGAVNIASGELSVNAGNINATTVGFTGTGTELALTGTPSNFHGTLSGFAAGDSIDLAGTVASAVTLNARDQLVVTDGSTTVADLQLSGNYGSATFVVTSDGAGGSLIKLAVSAASALSASQNGQSSSSVVIADTAANIVTDLDGLQSLAAADKLASITLTDSGTPTLSVSAAQAVSDATALHDITGSYTLNIPGTTSAIATFLVQQDASGRGANGIATDHAGTTSGGNSVVGFQNANFTSGIDTVVLDGPRSSYAIQVTANGATTIKDVGVGDANYGQSVTVSGETYIVFNGANLAASTVIASGAPTYPNDMYFIESPANAQLAEFYAAVFQRTPDLAGLEYWQGALTQGGSILNVAQDFLNIIHATYSTSSPITTLGGDPTAMGNTQFITELYQNILGRQADPGGLAYWQAAMNGGATEAQILVAFTGATATISAVNAEAGSGVGTGSGWLIAPSVSGGYADPGLQMTAPSVLTQAAQSNNYNLSLIDPASLPAGGLTVGGATLSSGKLQLSASAPSATIVLASSFTTLSAANSGDVIHDGPGADAITVTGSGDFITVGAATTDALHLAGGTNSFVFNFTPGKGSLIDAGGTGGGATTLLNGTATAVQGSSLTFGGSAPIYVNIGSTGGGTTAEAVTTANKAYVPADVAGEHVMFLGTDSGGDTQIWSYKTDGNHQVDAAALILITTLIGVPAANLTAVDLA